MKMLSLKFQVARYTKMLLGKELYSKEVLLILFFFFMKETWSHISCQRPGNPYYDKKKVGYFWLPKARKPVTMLA